MSYSYKQWSQDQTADNVIHASDLERWQDGITDAGGTWSGSWTDEKDTLTADQLNALETEIASLYGTGFTAKTWEDGQVPGVDEWNRIEDAINTILNRTAFAIYCETDNSLTFYVDTEVPSVGDTYEGKVVTEVYTGLENTNWTSANMQYWYDVQGDITSIVIDKSFNLFQPRSLARWFQSCSNATFSGLQYIDSSNVTGLTSLFYGCSSLTNVDGLAGWDTSKSTGFGYLFYGCSSLTNVDGLAGWDTSKSTGFGYLFYGCSSLTNVDGLANWDVSNVTGFGYLFYGCSSLTNVDGLANWNTSSIQTLERAFDQCEKLASIQGLAGWSISSVTNISYMFRGCALTDVSALANWDVSNVTTMANTFRNNTQITTADISKWNTAKVTNMNYMFGGCTALTTIYSDDNVFVTTAVTSGDDMFNGVRNIVGGNGTTYDSSKVDSSMAHIDTEDNPGYFTAKG